MYPLPYLTSAAKSRTAFASSRVPLDQEEVSDFDDSGPARSRSLTDRRMMMMEDNLDHDRLHPENDRDNESADEEPVEETRELETIPEAKEVESVSEDEPPYEDSDAGSDAGKKFEKAKGKRPEETADRDDADNAAGGWSGELSEGQRRPSYRRADPNHQGDNRVIADGRTTIQRLCQAHQSERQAPQQVSTQFSSMSGHLRSEKPTPKQIQNATADRRAVWHHRY